MKAGRDRVPRDGPCPQVMDVLPRHLQGVPRGPHGQPAFLRALALLASCHQQVPQVPFCRVGAVILGTGALASRVFPGKSLSHTDQASGGTFLIPHDPGALRGLLCSFDFCIASQARHSRAGVSCAHSSDHTSVGGMKPTGCKVQSSGQAD